MSLKRSLEVTVDIVGRISVICGQRVLLDLDLAALYGVTAKRLNEQVRRNADRFPADFAFQSTDQEVTSLRSRFATFVLRGLLFGVDPTDPASFAITIVVLGAAAFLACYGPARRAARIDPMTALRAE